MYIVILNASASLLHKCSKNTSKTLCFFLPKNSDWHKYSTHGQYIKNPEIYNSGRPQCCSVSEKYGLCRLGQSRAVSCRSVPHCTIRYRPELGDWSGRNQAGRCQMGPFGVLHHSVTSHVLPENWCLAAAETTDALFHANGVVSAPANNTPFCYRSLPGAKC